MTKLNNMLQGNGFQTHLPKVIETSRKLIFYQHPTTRYNKQLKIEKVTNTKKFYLDKN